MSDLISRKAVIDYLRERHDIITIENNNQLSIVHPEALKGMKCSNEAFNHFILGLPTAYDVDKTVEQLQKASHNYYPSVDSYCTSIKSVKLSDAVLIVKGGAINE